jgi:PAS domain S-box-containing protein
MPTELRKTGISVVGDLPWGTHLCHFYETKEDLLDILLPYFKAGLENNEYCLWIVLAPLELDEAKAALRAAVPEAEQFLATGAMEIISSLDWYLPGGVFNPQQVIKQWQEKYAAAVAQGYDGLRANGNETWLNESNWQDYAQYEKELNELIKTQRMLLICTYSLASISGAKIFDVVQTHEFAIAKRQGQWEVIVSPALRQVKTELKRLNDELEQRVQKRTDELADSNEELRREINVRRQVEEELRRQQTILQKIFDHIPVMIGFVSEEGRLEMINRACERTLGWTLQEVQQQNWGFIQSCFPTSQERLDVQEIIAAAAGEWTDLKITAKDGRVIDVTAAVVSLIDGTSLAIGQDISKRKQAEEKLRRQTYLTEQVINSLPGIFYVFDEERRFLRWNENFERVTGYTREELQQISPLDLFTGEDQIKIQECVENVFLTGKSTADVKLVAKDGTRTPYHFTGRRVTLDNKLCSFVMAIDATERKQMEEQLKSTSAQLRALMTSLRSAKEAEGRRIARELHDNLGSALTGLKIDLTWVSRHLPEAMDETVRQKLANMADHIDEAMQQVRNIATELRPSVLDDLGLVAAIKWQAKEFQQRTEIICRVTARQEEIFLSPEKSTALFRILQEILTNVARHAQATSVQIRIEKKKHYVELKVADNGRGIQASELSAPTALGLLGMRERAADLGGSVEITGAAGKGTTVTVQIPEN